MKTSYMSQVVASSFDEFVNAECPDVDQDDAFTLFASSLLLKDKVSLDSIDEGIVDGGNDGGIDGLYVFLNGMLLSEDSPYLEEGGTAAKMMSKSPVLEVRIIQSKNKECWEESVWEKLVFSVPELLDPEADEAVLSTRYNSKVVARSGIYRKAMRAISLKFPTCHVKISYVSRAPEENISATIEAKRGKLLAALRDIVFSEADMTAEHVGVDTLYKILGQPENRTVQLKFTDLLRTDSAYLGLVKVSDYLEFLKTDEGVLSQDLFNANVRDYEGENLVNAAIAETLQDDGPTDFWWQNNGITILASEVSCPVKTMSIENPLVVNGLQTSMVIHSSAEKGALSDRRNTDCILVRVISSSDGAIRDAVIAGSNRQTSIPSASLFALNQEQVDIERYFESKGWFYERRRNYYRNRKVPDSKRVEMLFLAQAIMTLSLGKPNTARARPTTLLSKDEGYDRVFAKDPDCEMYLTAARMLKEVDSYLKKGEVRELFDERTNSRHYVLLAYYMLQLGIKDLANLKFSKNAHRITFPLDETTLDQAHNCVIASFEAISADDPQASTDNIAKGSSLLSTVVEKVREAINAGKTPKAAKTAGTPTQK